MTESIKSTIIFAVIAFFFVSPGFAFASDKISDIPEKSELTEKVQYALASKLYSVEDNKKNAFYEYRKFIKRFPRSDKAPQAQFMLGEALFFESARTFSQKIITDLKLTTEDEDKAAVLSGEIPFVPTFDNAIEEYRKIAGYPSNEVSDDALFRIGECYYNKGSYEKAIEAFKELTGNYADSYFKSEAIYSTALCHMARGKWVEAGNVLVQLGAMYPAYNKSLKVQFGLGIVAYYKKDFQGALEKLKEVKTADGYFFAGQCLDKQGKGFSAIVNYKKLLLEFPGSEYAEKASFSIPESFYYSKDYASAIYAYKKHLEQFPKSPYKPYASYKIGCSYFFQKNYDEAIKIFDEVGKTSPENEVAPLSAYLMAEALRKQNKISEAKVKYGSVVSLFGTNEVAPSAQYKIGWCFYKEGAYSMASGAYLQFDKDFGRHELLPYVFYMMANNYYKQKKYAEASSYYGLVLDKLPSTNLYEASLCLLNNSEYEQHKFDQIVTNYQYIVNNLKPSDNVWRARTLLYGADAYFRTGLYKEAQMAFELVRRDFKNTAEAMQALSGISYVAGATGKYEVAEKEIKKILETISADETKDSKDKMVLQSQFQIANNLFNQKKYLEALDIYEKYAKENPESSLTPEVIYRSGLCYYRLEYYSSAIKSWEMLVEKYKTDKKAPEALFQVADTYFRAQKYIEAVAAFRKLTADYPETKWVKEAQLRVGQSYYNAKDYDLAIKEYKKYLETCQDDSQVAEAVEALEAAVKKKREAAQTAPVATAEKKNPLPAPQDNTVAEYIDILRAVLVKYPVSKFAGEVQFKIGKKYYDEKQYANAAKDLVKLITDYSETASAGAAHFYLAESYYKLQNYEEALGAYGRYIKNFPGEEFIIDALFHSATSNYNLKKFPEAVESYKEILKGFPASEFASAAMFNMALAYKKANLLEEAARTYIDFNTKYPADQNSLPALLEAASIFQKRQNYELAVETYKKYPMKAGDDASLDVQFQIADGLLKQEKNEEAEKELRKLLEMQPKANASRLTGLAKLAEFCEAGGKFEEAIKVYSDIIQNAGKDEWSNAAKLRVESIKLQITEKQKTSK